MSEHLSATMAGTSRSENRIHKGVMSRRRTIGTAGAIGAAGSVLIALASPRLLDGAGISWWYTISFPFAPNGNRAVLYLGMALLCGAWLWIGYAMRAGVLVGQREMWFVTAAWIVPLLVAPSVFSRDMYSYLAQGAVLHVGLDPYHHGPIVLRHYGDGHLVDAVSPLWWRTPAPYGPLFLAIVSLIFAITGSHLVAGVVVVRLLTLAGVVLIVAFVPRICRVFGTKPVHALWLTTLSPLVTLELVLAGHNDALMAGLMVAGIALFLDGRHRAGILLCVIASIVKLPALAAVVFLAVVWIRSEQTTARRLRTLAESAGLVVIVIGGVSAGTGVGLGWLSSAVLTVPGKVHLAITPVTQLGWTVGPILRTFGVHVSNRAVTSGFSVGADVGLVALAAVLLYRADRANLVRTLGILLVVAALFGPAAWPWYFIWGLALLSTTNGAQRSLAVAALVVVSVFLVKPDGVLALPVGAAPAVLAAYVAAGAAAIVWRRRTRITAERHGVQDDVATATAS